jgi:hypothetical protein
MSELWRYGIHRQKGHGGRSGSLQRGLLWTLWLAALSVAAYSGYSLSHVDHNQIVVSPLRSVQSDARVRAVDEPSLPKKSANTEPDMLPLQKKNTTFVGTVEMANTAAVTDPLARSANDSVPVMAVLKGMGLAGELATPSVPLASPTALRKDSPEAADNTSGLEAHQAKAQSLQMPFVAERGVAVAKANLRIEPEFADSNCSEPLNAMQLCGSQASKADTYRQP